MSDSSRSPDREELPRIIETLEKAINGGMDVRLYAPFAQRVLDALVRLESENERLKETALTPSEAKAVESFIPSENQTWVYTPEFGNPVRSAIKKLRRSATSEETSP
jgi:hypothetical protein